MKKILVLILMILLTGCSATINVNIGNEEIKQNIYVESDNIANTTILDKIKESVFNVEFDTEVLTYFDIKDENKNNLKATRQYEIDNYTWDTLIARCYDDQEIKIENDILYISTSSKFNCYTKYNILEDVTLNLTSDYEILSSNEDFSKNGVYTWKITEETANNKPINLAINLNNNIEEKNNITTIVIIISIAIITFSGMFLTIYLKNKKSNEI